MSTSDTSEASLENSRDRCVSEMHRFHVGDRRFAFLIPSSLISGVGRRAASWPARPVVPAVPRKSGASLRQTTARRALRELAQVGAVRAGRRASHSDVYRRRSPLVRLRLSTIVLNVTDTCNLSCSYCYEYGDDRLRRNRAPPESKAMDFETARAIHRHALPARPAYQPASASHLLRRRDPV